MFLFLCKKFTKAQEKLRPKKSSVLEEYKGSRNAGHILDILHILTISRILIYLYTAWADRCQSTIVYARHETAHMLYVIPVSSILERLPLPVGTTGTIPINM
jgi:hypothetical protein